MWYLGNREPHLIPQQLLMGATKECPLLSVVSTSSCCFGTQTHRLLVVTGRILGKHEGLCAAGRRKMQLRVTMKSSDRAIWTQHQSDAEQSESRSCSSGSSCGCELRASQGGCLCPAEPHTHFYHSFPASHPVLVSGFWSLSHLTTRPR